jgi:hypothetical protein
MRNAVLTLTLLALTAGPASAQAWAEKMFKDGLTHDFGTVAHGAELFHRFTITNIYAVRMEITNVSSGCGCVTATPAKRVLEPREATTLDVSMDARRFTGAKTVAIRVSVGPEYVSTAELKVTANSRADVVFNPGQVSFGSVTSGQGAVQTVDVEYAGTLNWKVSEAVVGKDLPLEATVAEWYRRPGQVGYKVKVTLKADAPVGALKEFVYLQTNDPSAAAAPLLVEAQVQPALTVTPQALGLGAVKAGEALTRRVVVRGGKPFKVLGVDGVGDGISAADLSATPATVQTVTLKCQLTQAGDFKRELKIKTDLQEAPVTVVVEGSVAP